MKIFIQLQNGNSIEAGSKKSGIELARELCKTLKQTIHLVCETKTTGKNFGTKFVTTFSPKIQPENSAQKVEKAEKPRRFINPNFELYKYRKLRKIATRKPQTFEAKVIDITTPVFQPKQKSLKPAYVDLF